MYSATCHRRPLRIDPIFAVTPILFSDLPLFGGRILTVVETAKLFILVDMQPEFYDDSAPVVELLFKFIDLPIGPLPVLCGAEPLQCVPPSRGHTMYGRKWRYAHLWQACPKPPKIVMCKPGAVGPAMGTTSYPRGSSAAATRRIFPPFPAASQPS